MFLMVQLTSATVAGEVCCVSDGAVNISSTKMAKCVVFLMVQLTPAAMASEVCCVSEAAVNGSRRYGWRVVLCF